MSAIIIFIQKAIAQGIGILFGASGEILTEKSGNLNLGVPGMMYMGGVAGLMGAFLYENGVENPVPFVGMLIALACALLCAALLAMGAGALAQTATYVFPYEGFRYTQREDETVLTQTNLSEHEELLKSLGTSSEAVLASYCLLYTSDAADE